MRSSSVSSGKVIILNFRFFTLEGAGLCHARKNRAFRKVALKPGKARRERNEQPQRFVRGGLEPNPFGAAGVEERLDGGLADFAFGVADKGVREAPALRREKRRNRAQERRADSTHERELARSEAERAAGFAPFDRGGKRVARVRSARRLEDAGLPHFGKRLEERFDFGEGRALAFDLDDAVRAAEEPEALLGELNAVAADEPVLAGDVIRADRDASRAGPRQFARFEPHAYFGVGHRPPVGRLEHAFGREPTPTSGHAARLG